MNKFAMDSIKIKSSWLDGNKKSMFQLMGKEEGLNLYFQLFRFRIHQGNYNEHIFALSIGSILPYTKMNIKTKLSKQKVFEMLKQLEKLGIIQLLNYKSWNTLLDHNGQVNADKFIMLKATDVPKTNRENETDMPIGNDDFYIKIPFNMVDYMCDTGELTSKHLSLFFLIRKMTNSKARPRKAWLNVDDIKDRLGFGSDKIIQLIQDLNKHGLLLTYVSKYNGKPSFEHHAYFAGDYGSPMIMKEKNIEQINRFLKRYNKNKQNPFVEV